MEEKTIRREVYKAEQEISEILNKLEKTVGKRVASINTFKHLGTVRVCGVRLK
jgi:DNA anti-recombination protein RmuC